jgi:hypothetical protein
VNDQILERGAERAVVTGPRHGHRGRAVDGTRHTRHLSDHQLARREADIDVPPAATAITGVVARRLGPAPAATAPPACPQTHLDLQARADGLLVQTGQFPADDHHLPAQTEHRLEYLVDAHAAVLLALVASPEQPEP